MEKLDVKYQTFIEILKEELDKVQEIQLAKTFFDII